MDIVLLMITYFLKKKLSAGSKLSGKSLKVWIRVSWLHGPPYPMKWTMVAGPAATIVKFDSRVEPYNLNIIFELSSFSSLESRSND